MRTCTCIRMCLISFWLQWDLPLSTTVDISSTNDVVSQMLWQNSWSASVPMGNRRFFWGARDMCEPLKKQRILMPYGNHSKPTSVLRCDKGLFRWAHLILPPMTQWFSGKQSWTYYCKLKHPCRDGTHFYHQPWLWEEECIFFSCCVFKCLPVVINIVASSAFILWMVQDFVWDGTLFYARKNIQLVRWPFSQCPFFHFKWRKLVDQLQSVFPFEVHPATFYMTKPLRAAGQWSCSISEHPTTTRGGWQFPLFFRQMDLFRMLVIPEECQWYQQKTICHLGGVTNARFYVTQKHLWWIFGG